jgi:hypothetical protein
MIGTGIDRAERWLFDRKKATYGLAVMRILLGVAILGSLVANAADRYYVWGAGSRWVTPWVSTDGYGAPFTWLGGARSEVAFTAGYLIVGALAAMFTVGWRTVVVTPLLLVALTGLMRLNPLATDAGDNIVRIVLLFLCFADVSMRWSLDARRRARPASGSRLARWSPPQWLGVLLHNVALLAVATQVCMIYVTSGLSKVQGEMWQQGVGLYYPLRIGQYEVWPALNELVFSSGLVVTVASYVTVFVQVFFPLLLMRRGTRVVALVLVVAMHVGIAVTMALPWFSLAMIATDSVFVRDDTYRGVLGRVRRSRASRLLVTSG